MPSEAPLRSLDLFPGVVGLMGAIEVLAAQGEAIDRRPVQQAIVKRRAEYVAGRVLACTALARLGIAAQDIGVGANRAPLWPPAAVGSISHTLGQVAVAVALRADYGSLGLDIELIGGLHNVPLAGLFSVAEQSRFHALDLTLIFSAKEALYKLLNPLVTRYIDHLEIDITLDTAQRSFGACANTQSDLGSLLQRVRGCYYESAGAWVTCAVLTPV